MASAAAHLTELMTKYQDSGNNKTDFDIIAAKIKLFEKKKVAYRFKVSEVFNMDKKSVKKVKKIINNNKYILFNSWYTKIRKSNWLNSHDMWNLMKDSLLAKPFVDIFDFMEKLASNTVVSKKHSSVDETSSDDGEIKAKKVEFDSDEIKENNERRVKLYEEFYRVLNVTFATDTAPSSSSIYDQKLKNVKGLDRLTRSVVQSGVSAFKHSIKQIETEKSSESVTSALVSTDPVAAAATRKRKQSTHTKRAAKQSKKNEIVLEKQQSVSSFNMVDDAMDYSQLSD